jgi:hypothetical protein
VEKTKTKKTTSYLEKFLIESIAIQKEVSIVSTISEASRKQLKDMYKEKLQPGVWEALTQLITVTMPGKTSKPINVEILEWLLSDEDIATAELSKGIVKSAIRYLSDYPGIAHKKGGLTLFFNYREQLPFRYDSLQKYKSVEDFIEDLKKAKPQIQDLFKDSDDKLISKKGIEELKTVGIRFVGDVPTSKMKYQCFHVPQGAPEKEEWQVYRKWLGQCGYREEGEKVELCTVGAFKHFETYKGYEDGFYVFFNMTDRRSPYHFVFANNEFNDKNNNSMV